MDHPKKTSCTVPTDRYGLVSSACYKEMTHHFPAISTNKCPALLELAGVSPILKRCDFLISARENP